MTKSEGSFISSVYSRGYAHGGEKTGGKGLLPQHLPQHRFSPEPRFTWTKDKERNMDKGAAVHGSVRFEEGGTDLTRLPGGKKGLLSGGKSVSSSPPAGKNTKKSPPAFLKGMKDVYVAPTGRGKMNGHPFVNNKNKNVGPAPPDPPTKKIPFNMLKHAQVLPSSPDEHAKGVPGGRTVSKVADVLGASVVSVSGTGECPDADIPQLAAIQRFLVHAGANSAAGLGPPGEAGATGTAAEHAHQLWLIEQMLGKQLLDYFQHFYANSDSACFLPPEQAFAHLMSAVLGVGVVPPPPGPLVVQHPPGGGITGADEVPMTYAAALPPPPGLFSEGASSVSEEQAGTTSEPHLREWPPGFSCGEKQPSASYNPTSTLVGGGPAPETTTGTTTAPRTYSEFVPGQELWAGSGRYRKDPQNDPHIFPNTFLLAVALLVLSSVCEQ